MFFASHSVPFPVGEWWWVRLAGVGPFPSSSLVPMLWPAQGWGQCSSSRSRREHSESWVSCLAGCTTSKQSVCPAAEGAGDRTWGSIQQLNFGRVGRRGQHRSARLHDLLFPHQGLLEKTSYCCCPSWNAYPSWTKDRFFLFFFNVTIGNETYQQQQWS